MPSGACSFQGADLRRWGPCPRASLDKDPHDVAAMFDAVAAPLRPHQRRAVARPGPCLAQAPRSRRVDAQPGETVLDLAAGTGTSAEPMADAGVRVIACDLSVGMLEVGKRRRPDLAFVAGDALHLPFADESFDAVTMSFGLRNVPDVEAALDELLRRHEARRPAGGLRVLAAHVQAVPHGLPELPHAGAAARRAGRVQGARRLRLPGGVDPRVARPGARWAG